MTYFSESNILLYLNKYYKKIIQEKISKGNS